MKISPKEFVEQLDKKIIGQEKAKKVLAVAMRNRWRRMQLDEKIRKEITPKNLLMIGPTGVGKTAIIRAMADIIDAPMVKVEATRYTQVGYIGDAVQDMIHELAEVASGKINKKREPNLPSKTKPWNVSDNELSNLVDSILEDMGLPKKNKENKKDFKPVDKNQVNKYKTLLKDYLGDAIYPIAVKYGYKGAREDFYSKDKGPFSIEQINDAKDKWFGFIDFCPLLAPVLTLLYRGYKPYSLEIDKDINEDIKNTDVGLILGYLYSFILLPHTDYIDDVNNEFLTIQKKKNDAIDDDLINSSVQFHNYCYNNTVTLNELFQNIEGIDDILNDFKKQTITILKDEIFKIAKRVGYDGKKSSIISNHKGFYTQNDVLSFVKYSTKIKPESLYLFHNTIDPFLASIGLVPKKLLKGLKGNERKKKKMELSKIIKDEYKKSDILKTMTKYIVGKERGLASLEYFRDFRDKYSKGIKDNRHFLAWKVYNCDIHGYEKFIKTPIAMEKTVTREETGSVTKLVHEKGIIFIDEIDKLASGKGEHSRDNVGKIGVQRDLLALLDGTEIRTRYGVISTENIMFIAAGAFHLNEVSDLMPELLGRLPIHVKLDPMSNEMLHSILKDSENSPINHHKLLLKTEGVNVEVTDEAIEEISKLTNHINKKYRNMGARTLHAVIEKVFSEVSFDAFSLDTEANQLTDFLIDKDYVSKIRKEMLKEFNDEYYRKLFKQMSETGIC